MMTIPHDSNVLLSFIEKEIPKFLNGGRKKYVRSVSEFE